MHPKETVPQAHSIVSSHFVREQTENCTAKLHGANFRSEHCQNVNFINKNERREAAFPSVNCFLLLLPYRGTLRPSSASWSECVSNSSNKSFRLSLDLIDNQRYAEKMVNQVMKMDKLPSICATYMSLVTVTQV